MNKTILVFFFDCGIIDDNFKEEKGIIMEVNQDNINIINKKFDEAKFDDYLLKNHEYLFRLFNALDEKTESHHDGYPLVTHMNNLKTLYLSSKFLGMYDKKYEFHLWHDYFWWRVYSDSKLNIGEGKYHQRKDIKEYLIRYSKCRNISDVLSLVHEYIHHISSRFPKVIDDTESYIVYCEMLSILGELNCLDYLYNKGYQASEVETLRVYTRYQHQDNINAFLFTEPLLKRFLSGKTITPTYLEDLIDTNAFYNKLGIKGINQNINVLASNEISGGLSYSHPLGLIWASTLHQDHISNEDFNNLIKNINILELEEFEKLLPRKSMDELVDSTIKEFDFKRKVI